MCRVVLILDHSTIWQGSHRRNRRAKRRFLFTSKEHTINHRPHPLCRIKKSHWKISPQSHGGEFWLHCQFSKFADRGRVYPIRTRVSNSKCWNGGLSHRVAQITAKELFADLNISGARSVNLNNSVGINIHGSGKDSKNSDNAHEWLVKVSRESETMSEKVKVLTSLSDGGVIRLNVLITLAVIVHEMHDVGKNWIRHSYNCLVPNQMRSNKMYIYH